MKKIGLIAIGIMIASSVTFAQQAQQKGNFQKKTALEKAENMAKEYNLTAQQTTDLTAYFTKQEEQRTAQMQQIKDVRAQSHENMQQMREQSLTELKNIIGEDNFNKMTEKRGNMQKDLKSNSCSNNEEKTDSVKAKCCQAKEGKMDCCKSTDASATQGSKFKKHGTTAKPATFKNNK